MTTEIRTPAEKDRQNLCDRAILRISEAWKEASGPNDLRDAFPALNEELKAAQTHLDEVWRAARLSDLVTIEDFKKALEAWEELNYQGIAMLKAVKP